MMKNRKWEEGEREEKKSKRKKEVLRNEKRGKEK